MIKNLHQYSAVKRQLAKWSTLRRRLERFATDFSIDATELLAFMDSRSGKLEASLFEFEELRKTGFESTDLLSLVFRLPTVLVEARIASGLTQMELAARAGIRVQQIHRYEKTVYSSIGLSKAIEIAKILQMELNQRKANPESCN